MAVWKSIYLTCNRTYFFALVVLALLIKPASAAPSDFVEINGHWQQGGVLFGRLLQPGSLWIGDRELTIADDGNFVFGLGRDHPETFTLKYVEKSGNSHLLEYRVRQRQYNIQRIEGVQQKHVSPPKEVLQRIREEASRVRLARKRDDKRADFSRSFIWPISGPITGVYGSQRVYNGVPKSPHYGIDIAAPEGAQVRAPAAGVVTFADDDLYYSGGTLIIDHGLGLSSTFIHLSKLMVKLGERVEQGQVVAEVGSTGRSTGPHLDWRMNWFTERVDPQLLMTGIAMPEKDVKEN